MLLPVLLPGRVWHFTDLMCVCFFSHMPTPINSVPTYSAVLRKIHCPCSLIISNDCWSREIQERVDPCHIFTIHWLERAPTTIPLKGSSQSRSVVAEKRRYISWWAEGRDKVCTSNSAFHRQY